MTTTIKDFTIVSITFNNEGIYNTIASILPLIQSGAKMIIQNGGAPIELKQNEIRIYNEPDSGIYDALNKGISKVETKFFMLLHAGDTFIGKSNDIIDILMDLEKSSKTISLNSQYIGSRLHSNLYWRPWMLRLGVQPSHLPCIYKSEVFKEKKYSLDIPIIADFDFFLNQVNWKCAYWNNKLLVKMETGGATSSGIKSLFFVSKCFYNSYGVKGLIMATLRIPLKLLQAIK